MKYSKTALPLALQLLSCRAIQPRPTLSLGFINFHNTPSFSTKRFSTDEKTSEESSSSEVEVDPIKFESPWSRRIPKNSQRFRQHINPLARKYQMQTEIKEEWPNDGTFTDPSLPLYIDIGCSKGGFLLDLAEERQKNPNASEGERNYLGLEIRPSVAQFAKGRVERRGLSGKLDFIGCNANVDLGRILTKYGSFGDIDMISIQYPDPHFKKSHQKRRVVTQELVNTLAKFLKADKEVFIQSDVKDVLDNMRETIREFGCDYFVDTIDDLNEYMEVNPIGVPTEREISVLDNDLPIYRTVFRRTSTEWKE